MRRTLRELFFEHHLPLFRGHEVSSDAQIRMMSTISRVIVEPCALEDVAKVPLEQRFSWLRNPARHMRSSEAMRGSLRWLHDPEAGMFNPSNNELLFHADYMYVPECVLRGLSLSAHELEGSSITRFADMVRAVERLPADLRARINGLLVENMVDRSGWRVGGTRYHGQDEGDEEPNNAEPHGGVLQKTRVLTVREQ